MGILTVQWSGCVTVRFVIMPEKIKSSYDMSEANCPNKNETPDVNGTNQEYEDDEL